MPNQKPTAILTGPTTAVVGEEVFFDGSASSDPDTPGIKEWNLATMEGRRLLKGRKRPGSSMGVIFEADEVGTQRIVLTVIDSKGIQAVSDIVEVNVSADLTPVNCVLDDEVITSEVALEACQVGGFQDVRRTWTKAILTAPSNGGTPCGPTSGDRVISRACDYDATPPPTDTALLADLDYQGGYKVPQNSGGGGDTRFARGLAIRYEAGDLTNPVHLISGAFKSGVEAGEVFEWRDATPTIPGSPTLLASYGAATIMKTYSDIYGAKRKFYYNGVAVPLQNTLDGMVSFHFDPVDLRLYWAYGFGYSSESASWHVGYSVLDYTAGTAVPHGPWTMTGQSWKAMMGGMLEIPASFVSNYLPAGMRLGIGLGGYFSVVASCDASMGPSLTAFLPPDGALTEGIALANTPLVGYWPYAASPAAGIDRASRPAYIEPGAGNPFGTFGPEKWGWLDRVTAAVWVHGTNKSGLIFFATLGMGQSNYISSQIAAEYFRHYIYTFSEADLAEVIAGTKTRYELEPTVEEIQFPIYDYTSVADGLAAGSPQTVTSIVSSGSANMNDSANGALVTFSSPHDFVLGQLVSIRGTSNPAKMDAVWSIASVPSSSSLRIFNTSRNELWPGGTVTGGAGRHAAGGVYGPIGATYDPVTKLINVMMVKCEGVNCASGQPWVGVYEFTDLP